MTYRDNRPGAESTKRGLIIPIGKRKTRSGRNAVVWVAA